LTDTVTKTTALRVLSTFLEMTSGTPGSDPAALSASPYMALVLARAATPEELKESLWHAGVPISSSPTNFANIRAMQDLGAVKDKDLLLNTAMELVDFQYLEDAVQNRALRWLTDLAAARPAVVMHL